MVLRGLSSFLEVAMRYVVRRKPVTWGWTINTDDALWTFLSENAVRVVNAGLCREVRVEKELPDNVPQWTQGYRVVDLARPRLVLYVLPVPTAAGSFGASIPAFREAHSKGMTHVMRHSDLVLSSTVVDAIRKVLG